MKYPLDFFVFVFPLTIVIDWDSGAELEEDEEQVIEMLAGHNFKHERVPQQDFYVSKFSVYFLSSLFPLCMIS
jgi:hypothetical protein